MLVAILRDSSSNRSFTSERDLRYDEGQEFGIEELVRVIGRYHTVTAAPETMRPPKNRQATTSIHPLTLLGSVVTSIFDYRNTFLASSINVPKSIAVGARLERWHPYDTGRPPTGGP